MSNASRLLIVGLSSYLRTNWSVVPLCVLKGVPGRGKEDLEEGGGVVVLAVMVGAITTGPAQWG
jgi:hypothetical protein